MPTNDPRFIEYKPGTCVDCGNELRFATEVENGNLCSNCGPGSLKWQKREEKENDTEFVRTSQEHTALRSAHGTLANAVRMGIAKNFDKESVEEMKAALADSEKPFEPVVSNAVATEQRIAQTINPNEANDSRERHANDEPTHGEHGEDFQTKEV